MKGRDYEKRLVARAIEEAYRARGRSLRGVREVDELIRAVADP